MTEAYEAGEYEKVAEAQAAISQIAIEKERLRVQKQRSAQQQQQIQQQEQVQQQPQQRQTPSRDLKLEAWMEKNTWFGPNGDKVMTGAARAIHNTLVAEEGFDPTSDDYYAEIDKRMRREMPNKFQADRKNVQAVTPAGSGNRSPKSGRKKQVELNAGQVALAQKLNIPLDKYAAEVAKIANRRN
jgi:actin-related protein